MLPLNNRVSKTNLLKFKKKNLRFQKYFISDLFVVKHFALLGEKKFVFSFSASVIKKANIRNLIKRRIKYYILQNIDNFEDGLYYIYFSKNLKNAPEYEEITTEFNNFLSKIHKSPRAASL
ncbi:ribonuclease P protein component [Patescibacteria group bacterium]|nr:ribonuclease P protein component [Patescibacteria group bacterium]